MAEETEKSEEMKSEDTSAKKPNKTAVVIISVLVGIVVVYGIVSNVMKATTSKVAEKTIEKAIEQSSDGVVDVDINKEGEEITIETEEGTFTAGKQEIPDNFPEDMPIYPESQVASSVSGNDGVTVALTSEDTVDEVSAYYKKELAGNQWDIVSTTTIENATVYGVEKGDMSGAVIISEVEGQTQISLSVQTQ